MACLTVEKVKEIAMANYEQGGHYIVECWSDAEIESWIYENTSADRKTGRIKQKRHLMEMFGLYHDQDSEHAGPETANVKCDVCGKEVEVESVYKGSVKLNNLEIDEFEQMVNAMNLADSWESAKVCEVCVDYYLA